VYRLIFIKEQKIINLSYH